MEGRLPLPEREHLEPLRLRPHHIFCDSFLPRGDLGRGEEFLRALEEIRELAWERADVAVVVTEGPDQLCEHCPLYRNGRCESPAGDEEKVRRWDARILAGLGVSYGDRFTAGDMLALVRKKAPLEFCRTRCPWRAFCGVEDPGG